MVRNSFSRFGGIIRWGDTGAGGGGIMGVPGRMVRNSFSRFGGIICRDGGQGGDQWGIRADGEKQFSFPDLGGLFPTPWGRGGGD